LALLGEFDVQTENQTTEALTYMIRFPFKEIHFVDIVIHCRQIAEK
jgi:hypothetical protein